MKLRQVRKASQQKMKVKVVMRSQKRALFLIRNLPSPAFTFFTEQDEVGRREAPSLAGMVPGMTGCHTLALR